MMRRSLIGLLVSLATAYLVLERQKHSADQLMEVASGNHPVLAAVQAGGPASGAQTPALVDEAGQPVDLTAAPPEVRAAMEQQLKMQTQLMQMQSRVPDASSAPAAPAHSPTAVQRPDDGGVKKFSYRDRNDLQTLSFAGGWTVVLERKLSDRYTALADRMMTLLERQLDRAAQALPRAAVAELRKVQVLVALEGAPGPVIRYNWSGDKGVDSSRDGLIEIPRAEAFIAAAETRPWMVMHELAHAYHHRVLGAEHAAVRDAYRDAVRLGAYERVRQADGRPVRSNAASSEREFFAELTRAMYGRSDYYPFVREEFQQHDLVSYRVIEAAWAARR